MSEIKGQILGIVLVIAVFGMISGILYTAFQSASTTVANSITEAVDPEKNKIDDGSSGEENDKPGSTSSDYLNGEKAELLKF